jgi:hypothetical protein
MVFQRANLVRITSSVTTEEPGVFSKPGGTMSLSARVSVPRAVLRSSSTSIGPYRSSESTILRCSYTKGWKIRRDGAQFTWNATSPDLYLLRRIYSILGIRPRHTGLPGQAFCTACWEHCGPYIFLPFGSVSPVSWPSLSIDVVSIGDISCGI